VLQTNGNGSGERFGLGPLGHYAEHNAVVTRSILTANEVQSLGEDEIIVEAEGLKIRAKKFSFYQNDELRQRSEMPPVTTSDVIRTRPSYHETLEQALGHERFVQLFAPPPAPAPPAPEPKAEPKPKPTPPSDARILAALAAGGFALKEKTKRAAH
jgi:type IV secretory pathway TraG/TraD family ATPase VirD4